MLSRYNAFDIEAALRAASPKPPFSPAADRAECNGNTVIRNLQSHASYELEYPGESRSTLKSNLNL